MTLHEIIQKLIGHINPVGETHTDAIRFENLQTQCELINYLLEDISEVAKHKNDHRHSVMLSGQYAKEFLKEVRDTINGEINEE